MESPTRVFPLPNPNHFLDYTSCFNNFRPFLWPTPSPFTLSPSLYPYFILLSSRSVVSLLFLLPTRFNLFLLIFPGYVHYFWIPCCTVQPNHITRHGHHNNIKGREEEINKYTYYLYVHVYIWSFNAWGTQQWYILLVGKIFYLRKVFLK